MKKLYLFIILLLPLFAFSFEDYNIKSVEFKPKEFNVGESVKCSVFLEVRENLELVVPETIEDSKWIDIYDISIDRKDQLCVIDIYFKSFKIGNLFIPDIDLGGIVLKNIPYYIQSSLDANDISISEPKGQLYLPMTFTYSLILILFLAGIPVLIFSLSGRIKNIRTKIFMFFTKKRPFKIFMKECTYLKDNLQTLESKLFYTKLINSFRSYLTVSTKDDFFSVTTGEMQVLLAKHFDDLVVEDILSIVKHSDEIRFSFKNENLRREEKDLLRIMEICSNFEKNNYIENELKGDVE